MNKQSIGKKYCLGFMNERDQMVNTYSLTQNSCPLIKSKAIEGFSWPCILCPNAEGATTLSTTGSLVNSINPKSLIFPQK